MTYIESSNRKQRALYWESSTSLTDLGERKVKNPIEIKVRWENRQQESLDNKGNTIRIDASIVVNQDLLIGSLVWLGKKTDWTSSSGNLFEVRTFSKVPNLKNSRQRRVAGLVRYSDKLPPLET